MGWLETLINVGDLIINRGSPESQERVQRRIITNSVMRGPSAPQKSIVRDNKLTHNEICAEASTRGGTAVYYKVDPRDCIHVCPDEIVVRYYDNTQKFLFQKEWQHKELPKDMDADILYKTNL